MNVSPALSLQMLDVRVLAKELSIRPIDLVRELQSDGVPLLPVSAKRWRVAEPDFDAWWQRRQTKASEEARQRQLRMRHVAGAAPQDAPKRRPRFRR